MTRARVEAFSDGVFAVAITLLVLDLPRGATGDTLIHELADQWPAFGAFVLSFVIIGIVWVNHHAIFTTLRGVDRGLLFINLAVLMSVVLLPFSTSLFAHYVVRGGDDAHVAAAVFSGSSLFMALTINLLYVRVGRHPELRADPTAPPVTTRSILRFGLGIVVYALCVPVAFVSAPAVFVVQALVAVYYVVDQVAAPGRNDLQR